MVELENGEVYLQTGKCGEEKETLEHFLFECEWYAEERTYLKNKIKAIMGGAKRKRG